MAVSWRWHLSRWSGFFSLRIWPQLFGVITAIWGVGAFSGPLLGALVSEALSWRWAFGVFSIGGLAMAAVCLFLLRGPAARRPEARGGPQPFPWMTLLLLTAAVSLIAGASIGIAPLRSGLLLAAGLVGLALFFAMDSLRSASRLFPSRPFAWSSPLGSGLTMVFVFSIATISFTVYGPLILTSLHGIPVLTTGWIIAAESIAWSILSVLVANAPPERERLIIIAGALMITIGVAGFAWAVPSGSIPAILVCAVLQGGGFGIAWPFVTRVIVSSAPNGESTIASSAVPTMQRIGYAVGAALCGIVANASGFSEGLSGDTAGSVAAWLFLAFLPLGIFGCLAAVNVSAGIKHANAR